MFPDVRQRLLQAVSDRPLFVATACIAVISGAAAAAPLSNPDTRANVAVAMTSAVEVVVPAIVLEPEVVRVWNGADVDGDGRSDFVNPTGKEPRGVDAYGEGEFGASRDGGVRRHEGVDYRAQVGQPVVAPISGYVTKIGLAYAGDQSLKFVEITNPALNYAARVFYVDPSVQVGETVALGNEIGRAKNLRRKYPLGMTNHVHLEIVDARGARIDASRMITATFEPAPAIIATAD